MRLQGKVAVITGGTSGIGEAGAIMFAQEGASVVVAGRNEERGAAVARKVTAGGGRAIFVPTDVTKAEDCERMVQTALEAFGKLDVLYCNAGMNTFGTAVNTSLEDWNYTLAINLTSVFLCCKYAVPALIANGGGSIITTGSAVGIFQGLPERGAYAASKAAVPMYTKCLALDFAKDKIRANCIAPGPVDTPMMRGDMSEATLRSYAKGMPIGRLGYPEEVAYCAVWLASDESVYVTGALIPVDGGRSISLPPLMAPDS